MSAALARFRFGILDWGWMGMLARPRKRGEESGWGLPVSS
jgi:hypothetical protein